MIELQNENLTLRVDPLGAQMMELRSRQGTQYLWNGDEKYWRDRAPVLFPYVARLTDGSYTLYSERYSMDIHCKGCCIHRRRTFCRFCHALSARNTGNAAPVSVPLHLPGALCAARLDGQRDLFCPQ